MNALDLFFFLVLDIGDPYVSQIPAGYRVLDGLFQVYRYLIWDLSKGCFHANCRCRRHKPTSATSCFVGELSYYDVHFGIPGGYEHSAYQCL